jgi:hypothetical protein
MADVHLIEPHEQPVEQTRSVQYSKLELILSVKNEEEETVKDVLDIIELEAKALNDMLETVDGNPHRLTVITDTNGFKDEFLVVTSNIFSFREISEILVRMTESIAVASANTFFTERKIKWEEIAQ